VNKRKQVSIPGFKAGLLVLLAVLVLGCAGGIPPLVSEKTGNSAAIYIMQPTSTASISGFGTFTVGTKFQVWDNDNWLGYIGSKDYIVYYAEPGTHYFMVRGENWDIVKIDVRAGRTYYLKTSDTPGFTAVRVILEPVNPGASDLDKWLDVCRQIIPKGGASEKMVADARAAVENAKSGKAEAKPMPVGWYR
jgi:hypothetical protein